MRNNMGAGIIIVSYQGRIPKYLALMGDKNHRLKHGKDCDLPKGQIDAGETPWDAALRETYEETGIRIDKRDVIDGPFSDSFLTMWVAEVPWGIAVKISKNPKTGKLEHDGYEWLEYKDIISNCYSYLCPFVEWANKKI